MRGLPSAKRAHIGPPAFPTPAGHDAVTQALVARLLLVIVILMTETLATMRNDASALRGTQGTIENGPCPYTQR